MLALGSPGRSRTYFANPDSKSGGPCRKTNRGTAVAAGGQSSRIWWAPLVHNRAENGGGWITGMTTIHDGG